MAVGLLQCPLFLLIFSHIHCANILCVFPVPSTTQRPIYQTIPKELSWRGHQVTVITANPNKVPNLTEIEISSLRDIAGVKNKTKANYFLSTWLFAGTFYEHFVEEVFIHFDTIFPDPGTSFDLILVDSVNPLIYGLGCRFTAPVIGLSSSITPVFNQDILGNPSHPALYFDLTSGLDGGVDFFERIQNFVNSIIGREFYHWYYLPFVIDPKVKKYFGTKCPHIWNLYENLDLIFANSVPGIRANVPNFFETSFLKKRRALGPDYLDQDGGKLIYIDLCKHSIPSNLYNIIKQTASELPYQVLWSCEVDQSSVRTTPIPLHEALVHKNVKVLVTRGDLAVVEEAIINSVPIVGIPDELDQVKNAKKLVRLGAARGLDYSTINKFELREAIIEVAENGKYQRNMQSLKNLIEDRPVQDLDKTIWWIEYIIRHKSGKFLKGPGAYVYWYEFLFLDLLTVVLIFFGTVVCVVAYFIKKTKNLVSSSNKNS